MAWFSKFNGGAWPAVESQLVVASVFDLNERNALIWGYCATITLAVYALLAAVCSEVLHGEDNLYRSVGLMCAIAAIAVLQPFSGLVACVSAGGVCVAIRYRHKFC